MTQSFPASDWGQAFLNTLILEGVLAKREQHRQKTLPAETAIWWEWWTTCCHLTPRTVAQSFSAVLLVDDEDEAYRIL